MALFTRSKKKKKRNEPKAVCGVVMLKFDFTNLASYKTSKCVF